MMISKRYIRHLNFLQGQIYIDLLVCLCMSINVKFLFRSEMTLKRSLMSGLLKQ